MFAKIYQKLGDLSMLVLKGLESREGWEGFLQAGAIEVMEVINY